MKNMLRNTLGTWGKYWELKGNTLGTREKRKRILSPPSPPKHKGEKSKAP